MSDEGVKEKQDRIEAFKDLKVINDHIKSSSKEENFIKKAAGKLKQLYAYLLFIFLRPLISRQRAFNDETFLILKNILDRLNRLEGKIGRKYPSDLDYSEFEDGFTGPEIIESKNVDNDDRGLKVFIDGLNKDLKILDNTIFGYLEYFIIGKK